MKILFISTMQTFPWGGSEELWSRVALRALEQKHSVQVCVKEWREDHPKIISLQQKGALVARRKSPVFSLPARIMFRILRRRRREEYLREIASFEPDCVLISQGGTFDFFYNTELLAFIQAIRKPYFIISQFNTESGNILPQEVAERMKALDHPWRKYYFVSERNLKSAERQAAMHLHDSAIIDNPVNLSVVQRVDWPETTVLQMACVARYDCRHKGQDILIETLADQEFKNVNYRLNFYGAGPDKRYLSRLVNFFNLGDKVTVHEHASDIDAIWKKHHVLILPSIAEGTPLALQECMLKGRPALVTDVGDCNKLVLDGETGFLCAVSAVKYLKEKLNELFLTPLERLKIMGDNAFALANKSIDLNASAKIFEDLEQSVMS